MVLCPRPELTPRTLAGKIKRHAAQTGEEEWAFPMTQREQKSSSPPGKGEQAEGG